MNETNDPNANAATDDTIQHLSAEASARRRIAATLTDAELDAKNVRRLELIRKEFHGGGLTPDETAELAILQPRVTGEIYARHFRPRVFEADARRMSLLRRQVLGDGDPLSVAEERELAQLQSALRAKYPNADWQSPFADPYLDGWLDETEARTGGVVDKELIR